MSWVAWLIVVQVLLVIGFIASTVVFLLGILVRAQPPAPGVISASDERGERPAPAARRRESGEDPHGFAATDRIATTVVVATNEPRS